MFASICLLLACAPASAQSAASSSRVSDDDVSFGALVRDLGRNFRDLLSVENAVILGSTGAVAVLVHGEDAEISREWSGASRFDHVFAPGDVMGGGLVQVGAAVGTYVVGRAVDSPRTALLGADLIRAQTINGVLTQGIKLAVQRQRPDGGRYSFPSGHTSATFATATVLQRDLGWRVGVPAYAVAAFVGVSRIQGNHHYPTDVLFGAAIGIVSARTATIGHGPATFALSPVAAPGTVALVFTRCQPRRSPDARH